MFPNLSGEKVIGADCEAKDLQLKKLGPGVRRKDSYLLGVSIATLDRKWYFPFEHPRSNNIKKEHFFDWAKDNLKDKTIVTAQGLYDFDWFNYEGFSPTDKIVDVQYAEALINENKLKYNLDSLCIEYLNERKNEQHIIDICSQNGWKGKPQEHLWKMTYDDVVDYAGDDAQQALRIYYKQIPILQEQNLMQVFELECGLFPILLMMRKIGVKVDENKLDQLEIKYNSRIKELQYELNKMVGFDLNVNASRSIQKAFEQLGIAYNFTEKGNPSFTHNFLEHHSSELAKKIVTLRQYIKTKNTFIAEYDKHGNCDSGLRKYIINGRIHCLFHPLKSDENGTVTGRLSSSLPNLQQMPSKIKEIMMDIRSLFIPEDGYDFCKGDYSQVELRILAHYARGNKADDIRQMYNDNPHIDFHQACADMIGIERKIAKNINFGVVYGMGRQKLCDSLGLSLEEGERVLSNYYKKMPFLKQTSKEACDTATRRGYVRTILNRRRRFPDSRFAYKALNAVVQGTSAEVLKTSMVNAYKAGLFNTLIPHLTVHDELDFSIPRTKEGLEATKELKHIFENSIKFKVPIIFELEKGSSWANLEKFELS